MNERGKILLVIALLIVIVPVSIGLKTTRINSGVDRRIVPAAFDFENIMADILWLKTIQFLGSVYLKEGPSISEEDSGRIYSMLERIVNLNPKFTPAYEYGGLTLSVCAPELALSLLETGIENNPEAGWKLPFYAGMVANQWMEDPVKACSYAAEVKVFADRPAFVDRFFARTASNAGNLRTALDAWKMIYKNAANPLEKGIAARALNNLADRILKESTDNALKQEAKWIKSSI